MEVPSRNRELTVPAGRTASAIFPGILPKSHIMLLRSTTNDALSLDNRQFAIAGERPKPENIGGFRHVLKR